VFARPPGGVEAPAKAAPHAFDLVGDNRLAVPRPAQDDAAVKFMTRHGFGDRPDERRVVHRFTTGRSEIADLVAEFVQQTLDFLLVIEPGMIGADGNFHETARVTSLWHNTQPAPMQSTKRERRLKAQFELNQVGGFSGESLPNR
jgi:hypothetical protein